MKLFEKHITKEKYSKKEYKALLKALRKIAAPLLQALIQNLPAILGTPQKEGHLGDKCGKEVLEAAAVLAAAKKS